MTRIVNILNIIYILIVVLFLSDILTGFDIKSQSIKTTIYSGIFIGTPLAFIWNLLFKKPKTMRIIGIVFPTVIMTLILIIGPMRIWIQSSAWQTQKILYQNGHLGFNTIELQMQDVGAFGYNKRTVEVLYLTPLFMISGKVPDDIDKRVEWILVDKEVNNSGLKFP